MLNNFVNFYFLFTKLSEIDPCETHINTPGGHAWRHFFMACSKLEAMINWHVCTNLPICLLHRDDNIKKCLSLSIHNTWYVELEKKNFL